MVGVQVFNRPVDWDNQGFTPAPEAGKARLAVMVRLTAEAGATFVRGGSRTSEMSSQKNEGWGLFGMTVLLPLLKQYNLALDWVLDGTYPGNPARGFPSDADRSANIVRGGDDYGLPPLRARWIELVGEGAALAHAYGVRTMYEMWNEPDVYDYSKGIVYWRGDKTRYGILLSDGASAARAKDPNASILNGGLVLGEPDTEGYMAQAIQALKDGTITYLAVHHHGAIEQFWAAWDRSRRWTPEIETLRAKVILNETGASAGTDHENAVNAVGKLLSAKIIGMAGASIFHIGCLPISMAQGGVNNDLTKGDPNGDGDFSLVDANLNPKEGYYALKTANTMVKGLPPVKNLSDNQNASGQDRYAFLFGDGSRKVLVGIRQRPTDAEISEAFGSASYAEYAMDGAAATPGSDGGGIIYLVSGFVPGTPATPESPNKPTPAPDPGGKSPDEGGSSGGCNSGLGMICLAALGAMFWVRKR